MAVGSNTKDGSVGIGLPISARPSAGPGSMMSIGFDEADDDAHHDAVEDADAGELLYDDEHGITMSVGEVRELIRYEIIEVVKKRSTHAANVPSTLMTGDVHCDAGK